MSVQCGRGSSWVCASHFCWCGSHCKQWTELQILSDIFYLTLTCWNLIGQIQPEKLNSPGNSFSIFYFTILGSLRILLPQFPVLCWQEWPSATAANLIQMCSSVYVVFWTILCKLQRHLSMKMPVDQQSLKNSDQPIMHQQSCCIQSHLNHLFAPFWHVWTSAARFGLNALDCCHVIGWLDIFIKLNKGI